MPDSGEQVSEYEPASDRFPEGLRDQRFERWAARGMLISPGKAL